MRTEYRYDAAGNLIARVEDAGAGRLNITTQYAYTPISGDTYAISRVTDPLGQQSQLTYTPSGALRSATDPLGHTSVMTYTVQGWLAAVTTPGGGTTRTTCDGEGRPISVTDPRGSRTTSSYDWLGRLKTVTVGTAAVDGQPALNQTITYDYDINGRVVRVTDPAGHASTRSYDNFGRPASTTDPLGNTTTLAYDDLDRVILKTVGANVPGQAQKTAYTYDAAGRPLTERVDPDGLNLLTQYRYTRAGSSDTWSLQEVVDPKGGVTAFHFNNLGQRDQTIDALGQVWRFQNDNLGRLVSQTDPLGHASTYTVDPLGRNTSLTEGGRTERRNYNADGTLASSTDLAGRVTTFSYDADKRVIGVDYPAGTADVAYSYDAAGNLIAMSDGLGSTSYAYDALNRLRSRTRDGRTVGYTYNANGQTAQIDYWGQGTVNYGYDNAGRLTSLTPWGAGATSYSYRGTGLLAGQTRGNGVTTTYDYDSASRLIGMLHAAGATSLQTIAYALDANGNRTRMTDGDGATTYAYDALNRLINVDYPAIVGGPGASSVPYTLNANGNRLHDGTTSYAYDAAGRISSPGYSYDDNGNLLNDETTSYEYDAANRLTRSVKGGVTTTYGYDGKGNLIRETVGGVTTDFVLDERGALPTILGEVRSDGVELRYAYGPEGVTAQQTSSNSTQAISYPLLDALGSVRQLTDGSGAVTLARSYDAFGDMRHAAGTGWTPLGFTGERMGVADGTLYLRARHYSPTLGRFLQRDTFAGTFERPQSLNRYAYTENNPATLTDPSGHCIGYLFNSTSCRPVWEIGRGINVEDGKKYWVSAAQSALAVAAAPVEFAYGMLTNPGATLRGAIRAPFQALHDVYQGIVCDDDASLARGLVGGGAMAIGAAEGLERSRASAAEDGRLSLSEMQSDIAEEASKPEDVVAFGHGAMEDIQEYANGGGHMNTVTLGKGQYVTIYGEVGDLLTEELGHVIAYARQTNSPEFLSGVYSATAGPGDWIVNLTLRPPTGPDVRVPNGTLTVDSPTTLREILSAQEGPVHLHWAACLKCAYVSGGEREMSWEGISEEAAEGYHIWRGINVSYR